MKKIICTIVMSLMWTFGSLQVFAANNDTVAALAADLEAAPDEMITTGDFSTQEADISNENIEALIEWLKSMVDSGKLDTSDEQKIRDTIKKGEEKYGVNLSEEEENKIINIMKKMDSLGLDGSYLVNQAEKLYQKYGSDVVNHTSEAVNEAVDEAVNQAANSFLESLKESFNSFLKGLFGKNK